MTKHIELTQEQLDKLIEAGKVTVNINQDIKVFVDAPAPVTPTPPGPGNGGGDPDPGDPGDPDPGGGLAEGHYEAISNGTKGRLALHTAYKKNGVIEYSGEGEGKKKKMITYKTDLYLFGSEKFIVIDDENFINGETIDSESGFVRFARIAIMARKSEIYNGYFRDGVEHPKNAFLVVYDHIKPTNPGG